MHEENQISVFLFTDQKIICIIVIFYNTYFLKISSELKDQKKAPAINFTLPHGSAGELE